MSKDIDAQAVFDRLDALSRKRALTEAESITLEQAVRILDGKSGGIRKREAARLGVKRSAPWSGRPITERMMEALADLQRRWNGKRQPKAFYLGPADWTEFKQVADIKATVRVAFGNNPTVWRDEPAFNGVPVRPSENVPPRQSRLYDHTTTGRPLPP